MTQSERVIRFQDFLRDVFHHLVYSLHPSIHLCISDCFLYHVFFLFLTDLLPSFLNQVFLPFSHLSSSPIFPILPFFWHHRSLSVLSLFVFSFYFPSHFLIFFISPSFIPFFFFHFILYLFFFSSFPFLLTLTFPLKRICLMLSLHCFWFLTFFCLYNCLIPFFFASLITIFFLFFIFFFTHCKAWRARAHTPGADPDSWTPLGVRSPRPGSVSAPPDEVSSLAWTCHSGDSETDAGTRPGTKHTHIRTHTPLCSRETSSWTAVMN